MRNKIQSFQWLLMLLVILTSCSVIKKSSNTTSTADDEKSSTYTPPPLYRASATIMHDLVHTRLNVFPDWPKMQLQGTAELTLRPYFYPTDKLFLNARGMTINEVLLVKGENKIELAFRYENDSINITLDKIYFPTDTFKVYIDYVARPEELESGGSAAITNDKGLYFINADGMDAYKPVQLWTQGETQSNSVWFPTIDQPNQRCTQEIYITVDTSFVTLSNGLLVSSIVNGTNGTRTDYWKQSLPHAPYLFMMAIGHYAVVKESWKKKEISYYVEPEYAQYAKKSFGNTPEMLDFFSGILGVDYAWDKYSQVVVRDYVSGAMENTTAVVFGEFMNQDDRELLDRNYEDIIAHEAFHHWFGDLVTMESWSNIPLNESFATYGEYLWFEHKYGRDQADYTGQEDLNIYMREARTKQVDLIRYHFDKREDMFDAHSYQKGGRILHMLRKYTGDKAFFKALNQYLVKHMFSTVEIHDLRLAFEDVTGEDLNWFFNQWFLDKGHPSLKIDYNWDAENKTQLVTVKQLQSHLTTPIYKLPVDIDFYTSNEVKRIRVNVTKPEETFEFKFPSRPELVNFDAEKMLLCTKTDNHTTEEWITMYNKAPLYLDRMEALTRISKSYGAGTPSAAVVMKALDDSHWNIRIMAIRNSGVLSVANPDEMFKKLSNIVASDPVAAVRDEAVLAISEAFTSRPGTMDVMSTALKDSSYAVMQSALMHTLEHDRAKGLEILSGFEKEENKNILSIVSGFYSLYGSDRQYEYMTSVIDRANGYEKYSALLEYARFLLLCTDEMATKGIDKLAFIGLNDKMWYVRFAAAQGLSELAKSYGKNNPADADPVKKMAIERLEQVKQKETDPSLLRIYNK